MHVFLSGRRHAGKSTVIQKTISLLKEEGALLLGGFLTYWGDEGDPRLYISAADPAQGQVPAMLAEYLDGRMLCYTDVFDKVGVDLLRDVGAPQLICMDELGFLEADSPLFIRQVLQCLDGGTPVIGVLREGDIPWHEPVKKHPDVTLHHIRDTDDREQLPYRLAEALRPYIRK